MISAWTAARGLVLTIGLLAVPATASAAPTRTHPEPAAGLTATRLCTPIRAAGVGQDLGNGQTTATISSHGLLLGTTAAGFTVTGQVGTVASFMGPIVLTNRFGTITAPVTGTLDVSTGDFRSSSTTLSGSGAYQVITGSLTFSGNENLLTGAFTELITGDLCVTIR
jgi:hypothetical protein